jgi:anaerobic selenocysteine-containing dehydrogenase
MFGSRAADLALRAALKIDGPKALSLPLFVPSLGARPLSRLRRFPHGISLEHRERPGDFLKRRIRTPDRRVQLFPHDVYARLPELQSSLSTPPGDDHTLSLITKRERLGHNSWMHENAALTTPEHAAWFSRSDAERLGLSDGDRVRLEASGRAVELPARITDDLIAGSVAVPHGYGHEPDSSWQLAVRRGGQNINRLAESGPGAVDPLSGMCRFVGLPVRVTRLAASAAERAAE